MMLAHLYFYRKGTLWHICSMPASGASLANNDEDSLKKGDLYINIMLKIYDFFRY